MLCNSMSARLNFQAYELREIKMAAWEGSRIGQKFYLPLKFVPK